MLSILNISEEEYIQKYNSALREYLLMKENAERLGESIAYYCELFIDKLHTAERKQFEAAADAEKEDVYHEMRTLYKKGMNQTIQRGANLLTSTIWDIEQEVKKEFFAEKQYKEAIIDELEDQFQGNEYEKFLLTTIWNIVKKGRKYFELVDQKVLEDAKVFSRMGSIVAFDILRDSLGIEEKISGYSDMLGVPFNDTFSVTPAFEGIFTLQRPQFEKWDIIWNPLLYGLPVANNIIAKISIAEMTIDEIKDGADKGILQYDLILQYIKINEEENLKYDYNQNFYVCDYVSKNLIQNTNTYEDIAVEEPRTLTSLELNMIQQTIMSLISRKKDVPVGNILLLIN